MNSAAQDMEYGDQDMSDTRAEGFEAAVGAFLSYLRDYRRSSPATVRAYANDLQMFGRFLRLTVQRLPDPPEITRPQIVAWLESLQGSANTIRRKYSALSSFWNFLLVTERADTSPLVGLRLPPKPTAVPRSLTPLEVGALLMVAECPWHRCALILLCGTGLRRAEIVALTLADVDLRGATLTVRHGKGDKRRVVPLSPQVVAEIRRYLRRRRCLPGVDALLVKDWGEPLIPNTLYEALKALAVRAGLDPKRITPHAFRHTFATRVHEAGADIRVIQELLGHTDIGTTARYVEVGAEEKREAVCLAGDIGLERGT